MKNFDVMFSADKKYIDILLASIYSFLLNSNLDNIRVHIIESNFYLEDYQKIEQIINKFPNVELYFYPLKNFNIEKYKIPNWKGGQIANARLFFEEIIKPHILDIKNLLYLDSDTITISDITEIKNYQDGIYAVKDGCLKTHYQAFSNLQNYYNSGVIFISIEEWNKEKCLEKIIKVLQEPTNNFHFPDQDIFNIALSEIIKELPVNYNLPPHAYLLKDSLRKLYFHEKYRDLDNTQITEAKKNPKILHSYGLSDIKPWESKFNPYHEEYMKYISIINPNFQPNELNQFKKIISHLPRELYSLIILSKTYMPLKLEKKLKTLVLKHQQELK